MRARKLLTVTLLSIMIICLVFVFVACEQEEGHKHEYSAEWTYDEDSHWHKATCEHTEEIKDKEEHSWGEGETIKEPTHDKEGLKKYTCSICSAVKEERIKPTEPTGPMEPTEKHNYKLREKWGKDDECHWHTLVCADCGDEKIEDEAVHIWDENGKCNVCDYVKDLLQFKINEKQTGYNVVGIKPNVEIEEIIIPSKYNGLPVTSIGYSKFERCSSLTSIEIPDSVTSIGNQAFEYCSSLTSIEIPSSVTSIGSYAFSGCSSLTSIEIPSSVTSIGNAFSSCINLTIYCVAESKPSGWNSDWNSSDRPVVWNYGGEHGETESGIKWGLTKDGIMMVAGYGGTSTEVVIPETINGYQVTSIGKSAFYKCIRLTSIEIPNSVTSIGDGAFAGCSSLTSIVIPNSVTSIGNEAFLDCSSLTIYCEVESKPSGWKNDWNILKYYSSRVPVVWDSKNNEVVDNGKYYIADNGIRYMLKNGKATVVKQLTYPSGEIVIPREITDKGITYSVTSIGSEAFSGCSSLTSIEIPSSVTSIGQEAFYDCSRLTIYCEAKSKPSGWWSYWNILDYNNNDSVPVVWNCKNNEVARDGSIYYIADNGIRYALNNKKATVIRQLTSISGAIVIPNEVLYKGTTYSVTRIVSEAFRDCRSLTSIEIPSSVTSIGDYAFYYCISLTSITFGENSQLASIGSEAFDWCRSLTSIEIPNSVTSIGESAFSSCHSVTSIVISSNVTRISDRTFKSCSSLTSIEIPSNLTSIGLEAFRDCSSLTSIVIPSSVTSIDMCAFDWCRSLTIYCEAESKPSGWDSDWNILELGGRVPVVWNCKNNDVADNGNIYYIADNGIRYVLKDGKATVVKQLTYPSGEIVIPSEIIYKGKIYNVTSIDYGAFSGCSSLTSIEIPNSVTSIGNYAFSGCSSLTIYCEASRSNGWNYDWNDSNRPVVWNCIEYGVTERGIKWGLTKDGTITIAGYGGTSTEVVIPDIINEHRVTSIGNYAFYECSSLTSVEIPSSVTSIGNYAFSGCRILTIYCEEESKPIGWDSNWNSSDRPVVWNYGGEKGTTTNRIKWGLTKDKKIKITGYNGETRKLVIPETINGYKVTSIANSAFRDCGRLTSIVIPSSVTSIGKCTFYNCISLTIYCEVASKPIGWDSDWNNLDYNNKKVPFIWNYGGEYGVTESGIKWGLTKDGIITIAGYSGTSTKIVIPKTINGHRVTSIGEYAFYYCRNLTSIEIPDSVTSIGDYAFEYCSSLTSIEIPSSVTSIGSEAFYGCSSLTSIEIPSSVIIIGSRVFEGCSNLTIYCEAENKPSGWSNWWNYYSNRPVVWGYKG